MRLQPTPGTVIVESADTTPTIRLSRSARSVMEFIDASNCAAWLKRQGFTGRVQNVIELSGGVSNIVLRIDFTDQSSVVVKQSRERLRTRREWISRLDRIWRETEALEFLQPILPAGTVPQVLHEDRSNFAFVMNAIPEHRVWKTDLLEGTVDRAVAESAGRMLGSIHGRAWNNEQLKQQWQDLTVFDELRLTPFYSAIAAAHPRFRSRIESLISQSRSLRQSFVLADFSPKNLLVTNDLLVLVDLETAHYGDPAFDVGFFLSHLFLKRIRHSGNQPEVADMIRDLGSAFLHEYEARLAQLGLPAECGQILERSIDHLAACTLSRIDGTSPVDYLSPDQQQTARQIALRWLTDRPTQLQAVWQTDHHRAADSSAADSSTARLPGLAESGTREEKGT